MNKKIDLDQIDGLEGLGFPLSDLNTTNKTNLIGAINEVNLKASNAVNYLNIVKTVYLNGAQYDHNTWYPVVGTISLARDKTSTIYVNMSLEGLSNPSWSTHQNGFVVDFMIETIGGGWGATKSETRVLRDNANWVVSEDDSQKPVGFVQTFANSSPILFLRGGGVYYVRTDFVTEWTVRPNGYVDPMNSQFFGLSNQRPLIFDENIVKHGIKSDNIETYNCGKASDWFHTFKRGLVYRGGITNNTNAHLLDFGGYMNVTGNGTGNTNFPYSYGSTFKLPSEEGFSPILHFSHTGELTITTEWMYGFQSDRVVWDSINLNPNTFASNNELNNIYDQLSAKANTRLSNLVSNLSDYEKLIIKNKLGINTGSQLEVNSGIFDFNEDKINGIIDRTTESRLIDFKIDDTLSLFEVAIFTSQGYWRTPTVDRNETLGDWGVRFTGNKFMVTQGVIYLNYERYFDDLISHKNIYLTYTDTNESGSYLFFLSRDSVLSHESKLDRPNNDVLVVLGKLCKIDDYFVLRVNPRNY